MRRATDERDAKLKGSVPFISLYPYGSGHAADKALGFIIMNECDAHRAAAEPAGATQAALDFVQPGVAHAGPGQQLRRLLIMREATFFARRLDAAAGLKVGKPQIRFPVHQKSSALEHLQPQRNTKFREGVRNCG